MKIVPLGNTWEFQYTVRTRNASTGKLEEETGLTQLAAWFSATDGGAEIHADVKVTLAERASLLGTYYGQINKSAVDANLAAYEDQEIFEVVGDGSTVLASTPIRVAGVRRL